jgi:hypothetical protein
MGAFCETIRHGERAGVTQLRVELKQQQHISAVGSPRQNQR